jgi:predicted nuclease of restriction endonuclease-like (RecB) superfamily
MTKQSKKIKPRTTQEETTSLNLDKEYSAFLNDLKSKIHSARFKTALAVNHEVIKLYWYIGRQIIKKQKVTDWGDKLLETLSKDLRHFFPETRGFSPISLKRMRMFAACYPTLEFGSQPVTQLPWGHIQVLLFKIKDEKIRAWYAMQCLDNGWSRLTLERYIKNDLFTAQGCETNKATNFLTQLPSPQSSLAQEIIKSPYNFDFLGLHDDAHERAIEHASIQHITKFMLELGKSFAFVGSQVPITINDEEFFIDMLFYNLRLRCFTVIEIKTTKFKPEHTGQLNFYLSAVDDLMRHPTDNPSIGILLCKSRDKLVAEYALKDIRKPIGVSEYQLTRAIPEELKANFPTIEEIETELNELEEERLVKTKNNSLKDN